MASISKIEWTDASWTPIRARNLKTGKVGWHCEHATTGCECCYSEGFNLRLGTGLPFKPGHRKDIEIILDEKMLLDPLRWKKPRMIFVCSMTDAFADFVKDEWLDRMFAVMALTPQHIYQVLTKRAERMRDYVSARNDPAKRLPIIGAMNMMGAGATQPIGHRMWPLPNVWLGVSAERQQEWDERKPHLYATPAEARFVSAEPLLGPIDLGIDGDHLDGMPDWVIVGGESGPGARPMHPQWARDLRDQCKAAGVPYFFKQWGAWIPQSHHDLVAMGVGTDVAVFGEGAPGAEVLRRVGKKAAGRLLDGIEHNDMPRRCA